MDYYAWMIEEILPDWNAAYTNHSFTVTKNHTSLDIRYGYSEAEKEHVLTLVDNNTGESLRHWIVDVNEEFEGDGCLESCIHDALTSCLDYYKA